MDAADQANILIGKIKDFRASLERLAAPFRTEEFAELFDCFSADHWRRSTYGNALVRLRLFTENNFSYVETLGLLAVARYIFELSVWLRLFEKDLRYGLVFYSELLKTQLRYYEDTLDQLRREVDLLKRLEAQESDANTAALSNAESNTSAGDFGELVSKAMARVDAEASRHFSIFVEDAKTNGYGFQAYLVEKKKFPEVEQAIADIKRASDEFNDRVPDDVKEMVTRKWQWKAMAKEAGIAHEYDYIYTYASKLLHATPASLFTDRKNLEMQEMCLFLRYVYLKLLEIADMAHTQPECRSMGVP